MPIPQPEHAAHAIEAAVEIQRLLGTRSFGEGIRLRARIGINTGLVVGGLVGTPDQLGYTVHGDDVNLAARLEQRNKEHGTQILVSESTCRSAGESRFAFRRIGTVTVRGRSKAVELYTLAHEHEAPPGSGPRAPDS